MAAELTRLILKAFSDSGGVIEPVAASRDEETSAGDGSFFLPMPPGAEQRSSTVPQTAAVQQSAAAPGGSFFLTDLRSTVLEQLVPRNAAATTLMQGPSQAQAAPGPRIPLFSQTLTPRGQGPTFLQVNGTYTSIRASNEAR